MLLSVLQAQQDTAGDIYIYIYTICVYTTILYTVSAVGAPQLPFIQRLCFVHKETCHSCFSVRFSNSPQGLMTSDCEPVMVLVPAWPKITLKRGPNSSQTAVICWEKAKFCGLVRVGDHNH